MRFVGIMGASSERQAQLRAAADRLALSCCMDRPSLLVAHDAAMALLRPDDDSLLFGPLFAPGREAPLGVLRPGESEAVVRSQGLELLRHYWGGWVALFCNPDERVVVRAPFGELPCLIARTGGLTILASDPDIMRELAGVRFTIDDDGLARHLLAGDIRRTDTCLTGLCEVRGGERVTITAGGLRRETCWSPWRFAARDRQVADRIEADRRLRDQARYCATARVEPDARTVLLLSGGLDSSILAACLSTAGRQLRAINMVTHNPSGDEQAYARAVAEHLGVPLTHWMPSTDDVDILRSAAAHLPRPVARSFEQAGDRWTDAMVAQGEADLVLDGGGGDNVFCLLQSASPVADCLLDPDGRAEFWRLTREIGALADTSRWQVAWQARRRAFRRDRDHRWQATTQFLAADTLTLVPQALSHPWLQTPVDGLPGRAAHIALLVAAQGLAEDGFPLRPRRQLSPIVSQPLVETCLAIPSWLWFDRGNNRAAARRAFTPSLPAQVAWRRSKGTPDSFLVELFETNRAAIRTALLDGELAARRLLDRDALRLAIDDIRPAADHGFARLLQLMDAEAWVRAQAR